MSTNQAPAKKTTPWLPFPDQGYWLSLQDGELCAALILPNGDRNGTLQIVGLTSLDERGQREMSAIARFLAEHAEKIDALVRQCERAFWATVATSYPETGVIPENAGAAAINLGVDLKLAMRYALCDWVKHHLGHLKGAAEEQPSLLQTQ